MTRELPLELPHQQSDIRIQLGVRRAQFFDLPHRVERATGKPVEHVSASETQVEA